MGNNRLKPDALRRAVEQIQKRTGAKSKESRELKRTEPIQKSRFQKVLRWLKRDPSEAERYEKQERQRMARELGR